MEQDDIRRCYRQLRTILGKHQSAAIGCLARNAILDNAKHLGMCVGRTLVADSEEEMALVFDLAVHTARPGRSRAIGRHARAAALPAGSIEAQVLDALCQAKFSLWRVDRRHEIAGVVVTDIMRGGETWLMDENLTASMPPGACFASRLCWPTEFAVTCGVVVPVDAELVKEVLFGGWYQFRIGDPEALAGDPRFAAAIYRTAIESGVMETVEFREPMRLAS